ncbi:helix-hairpin-helix domain-containing protein [Chloroflexota bacterium]
MTEGRPVNLWALFITFLVAIIAIGSIVTWSRYSRSEPVEISLIPSQKLQGALYIDGAVNNPGFYPLKARDNLENVIRAAGGTTDSADLSQVNIHIPEIGEEKPQRVSLNHAEAWLLEALPGIGETRAQAIVDYRQKNGRFHDTNELIKVEGIGTATYERIKHLITVAD